MTLIDKAEALLPCPFCGDQPQFWNAREDVLLCPCLAGPEVHGTSRENAVEIWNRRVIPARGVGVKPETVKDAVMGWVWAEDSDVSKRLGPKHTDALIARILAALAPTDAATEKGGDAHAVDPRHAPHKASPGVTAGADAAQAREAALRELIDAYEDIMDYGIVFAKKPQQDRLNAAKEKLKETQ